MRRPATTMWRITIALLLIVPMTLGGLSPVSANTAQSGNTINLQIIVDQSGSMAAATDTGVLRIDAAKRVLEEVIDQIPEEEGVNVGLRVYGHLGTNQPEGQPESCVSSELLVPMQGVDKEALVTQVNWLQPVGWTPLGYALEQAANDFTQPASENVVNAIVMVTDGLETCGADPTAIAGELKNSPAGITTHVIGFGTTPEELRILEGITQSSGGQLLDSNNAGQLMDALFHILEELEVVEVSGDGSTREQPIAIGRIGRVGDYDVSVLSAYEPETSSTSPTQRDIYVRVSVTYRGELSGAPANDLVFSTVGQLNSAYTAANNSCSGVANSIDSVNELFEGGSGEFLVCWTVEETDAATLVMFVDPRGTTETEDRVWFSLLGTGGPTVSDASETEAPVTAEQTPSYLVEASDIVFPGDPLIIPANTDVQITLLNVGFLPHNFAIEGTDIRTPDISNGESATIIVNLPPGTYTFVCDVAGHTEAGQVGTLIVE